MRFGCRPTFWRIAKRRSTESFKGLPYICTLLCTSLWSYYGALKPGGILILSINVIGTVFQLLYLIVYLVYAPRHRQVWNSTHPEKTCMEISSLSTGIWQLSRNIELTICILYCVWIRAMFQSNVYGKPSSS
jgi:hypothetical protein